MNDAEKNKIWREDMQYRVTREKYYKPKVYKVLQGMIRDALNYPSINLVQQHIDVSINKIPLNNIITDLYTDAGRIMGGHSYQRVSKLVKSTSARQKALMPIGYDEDLVNQIIKYFQDHLLDKVVLPITETMKAWILKYLIDQQLTGKSIPQIVDEMVTHDFPRNRAFVITRTEVLRAANYGSREGAKKVGYKLKKTWITAEDIRVRRIPADKFSHVAMHGITIGMEELFQVPRKTGGYEELLHPGDPNGSAGDVIQCRCTNGFEVERDANGEPIKILAQN